MFCLALKTVSVLTICTDWTTHTRDTMFVKATFGIAFGCERMKNPVLPRLLHNRKQHNGFDLGSVLQFAYTLHNTQAVTVSDPFLRFRWMCVGVGAIRVSCFGWNGSGGAKCRVFTHWSDKSKSNSDKKVIQSVPKHFSLFDVCVCVCDFPCNLLCFYMPCLSVTVCVCDFGQYI